MRHVFVFLLSVFLLHFEGIAQVDHVLETDQYSRLDTVPVLIDKGYSFEDILTNPDLEFKKQTKISVNGITHYWTKCNVSTNFAYDKRFSIWTSPTFNTELFYFDEDKGQWQSVKGGLLVADWSIPKYVSCIFKADETTTFYTKVNVSEVNQSENELKTTIFFQNNNITKASREKDFYWWLITMAIVLAFLVYNFYWYVLIREKVYLYYLMILIGGTIYITGVNYFIYLFISPKTINATINSSNALNYTPADLVYSFFGSTIVISGFLLFTKKYLELEKNFPKWNRFLKYTLFFFLITQTLHISGEHFKWIEPNSMIFVNLSNLTFLVILTLILIIAFKCYAKKTPESPYFLKALFIPIILMLGLVVSLLFPSNNIDSRTLPNLALLSITVTFAVALIAKVNLIKDELSTAKLDKQAIVAMNEIEKERNLRLEEKIEYNKNEVAAAQQIKLLMKELHHRVKNNLQIVSSLLSLQSFRIKDQQAKDAIQEGQHRIEAMSLIHQKLYIQDAITQVNIKEFITDIAESLMQAYGYDNDNFDLQIQVEEDLLDVDKAIPLSIIINELITNAFKYAYNTTKHPKLMISFTKQSAQASISIADNGVGIDAKSWKDNSGYGKELIQTFTEQLEGTLTLDINNGTTFKIVFPY
jgi:two-component sensor histidine kinase